MMLLGQGPTMLFNCLIIESLISVPDKPKWMADSQSEPGLGSMDVARKGRWEWDKESQRQAGGDSTSVGNQPRVKRPRGAVSSSSALLCKSFFSVSCPVHIFKQIPKQAPLLSKAFCSYWTLLAQIFLHVPLTWGSPHHDFVHVSTAFPLTHKTKDSWGQKLF